MTGYILFVVYMYHKYGPQDLYVYILIASGLFLHMFIPTFFVHLQYYLKNKDVLLAIDTRKKIVKYSRGNQLTVFRFEDIEFLEQYKTPPIIEKRATWLPWATYNYAKVKLVSREEFIITCFLVDEFELPIDKSKIKLHSVFLPYIRK